jgi:hypothetical protein
MKFVTKLAAASVLALSVAAPAFADEETTLLEGSAQSVSTGHDAMAYAPAHPWTAAKIRHLASAARGDLALG